MTLNTWHYVGIGAAVLVVGNGLLQMSNGKPFLSLGDAQVYEGRPSVRTADFNRRGQVRLMGLSGHQARFGAAATSCGGRGYNQKQFRSCMSKSLR